MAQAFTPVGGKTRQKLSRLIPLSRGSAVSRYGTGFYTNDAMRALLAPEFAALLVRADVSQAAFARLTGVTPRQVNNWCRARAAVPLWAGLLAALLQDHSPEALKIVLEQAQRDLPAARLPA
jgi:hypothetical protein